MASKSKFQISRVLDERIKTLVTNVVEFEPEFADINLAYILGFHSLNTTNYVGLTTNYQLHHAGFPVVGLVFIKNPPSDEEIKSSLSSVKEYSSSPNGLGSFESDKNEDLFLIYSVNNDSNEVEKRIFSLSDGAFLEEKVKLSVIDETKIYSHSCMVKLVVELKLKVKGEENEIVEELDKLKKAFCIENKRIRVHLLNSNFSFNLKEASNSLTEILYDQLEVPDDVLQAGDYLPQMTKTDKAKLGEKWRNKMKSQRSPLEMRLEYDESDKDDSTPNGFYSMQLDLYFYLHVNDCMAKSMKLILFHILQRLELFRPILIDKGFSSLEPGELKSCTFKPIGVSHLVPAIYAIPSDRVPDYGKLTAMRRLLHLAYLVPLSRPLFRYSQRILNLELTNSDELSGYLCNVHRTIQEDSGIKGGLRSVIQGSYTYHHYMQDRASDSGWGCAYRSLQTIISWFKHQGYIYSPDVAIRGSNNKAKAEDNTNSLRLKLHKESRVPTHEEIQTALVDVGDKQPSFIGSQKWIGSQEVCYVLNHLYDLDSKFISVSSGAELVYKARELGTHFATQSTPIMIGGGVLAHTIIGVDFNEKNGDTSYLILDPHYTGSEDLTTITKKGWCGWKKNAFWDKSAFYNLCLPQLPTEF